MSALRRFLLRLLNAFQPGFSEADLERQMASHLALLEEDYRRRGMPADEARLAARRAFGGVDVTKDRHRDARSFVWLDQLRQDVRYALRSFARNRGFTAVAVLTLALGIGATTAVYSVVDTILWQPLPFAGGDRLVRLVENVPSRVAGRPPAPRGVTYQDFLEWRSRTRTLMDAVLIGGLVRTVQTIDGAARVWGATISADGFSLLGARPMFGRTFDGGDANNPNVVVLSFDTWQRVFHSDRAIVGRTIELQSDWNGSYTPDLERQLVTIVGVMPPGFQLPTGPVDLFAPLSGRARGEPAKMIARLRPGVSLAAAVSEANTIGAAIRPPLAPNAPLLGVPRFDVLNVKDQIVRTLKPALRVLLGSVVAVLLIVCANVANLLLARGTARQREIGVRLAIGASRGRIARQLLTESALLAMAGGALGAAFAVAGVELVKRMALVDAPGMFRFAFAASVLPRANEIGIEPGVFVFGSAFAIAALTVAVFGIAPAVHLSRLNHTRAMGTQVVGSAPHDSRLRSFFVVAQIVAATILLVAAGLLTRSLMNLLTVDKGYDPSHVLAFQLVFPPDYPIDRRAEGIDAVLARVRSMPNVESAGFTRAGVLIPEAIFEGTFVPQGRSVDEMRTNPVRPRLRPVSRGYLSAMEMKVLVGREFADSDMALPTPAVVISRAVAREWFGTDLAIGRFVDWYVAKRVVPVEVVGVIADVRNESPERAPNPDLFIEYHRMLALQRAWGDPPRTQAETTIGFLSFAIRTTDDPQAAARAVTDAVHSVDPNAGLDGMRPMAQLVSSSVARPRFYTVVFGIFAALAGVLAVIGVYGVLAYAVVQRTRELGIRLALGAQPTQVLALVLGDGARLTAAGIAVGLAGAAAASRLLEGMLFGLTPLDVRTFVAVAVTFGLVATVAAYLPARRATRIDPLTALRCD